MMAGVRAYCSSSKLAGQNTLDVRCDGFPSQLAEKVPHVAATHLLRVVAKPQFVVLVDMTVSAFPIDIGQ